MNLLIHTEIPIREGDANLLLAMQAVKQGFNVIIGSKQIIGELIEKEYIKKGIYHTKSITHNAQTSEFLRKIKKKNFLITAIDQEHGLLNENYSNFAKSRIVKQDLKLIDVFFCWGKKDYNFLQISKNYSKEEKKKFILCGAPRVEICKPKYKFLWGKIKLKKKLL